MRTITTLMTASITLNRCQDRPRPHGQLLSDHTIQTTSVLHNPLRVNLISHPNSPRLRNSECPRMTLPGRSRQMDSTYPYRMPCILNGKGMKWLQIARFVRDGLRFYYGDITAVDVVVYTATAVALSEWSSTRRRSSLTRLPTRNHPKCLLSSAFARHVMMR